MKTIKQIWEVNLWFWKESKSYVAPWKFKDFLYAPIAWFKFMKLCKKDAV